MGWQYVHCSAVFAERDALIEEALQQRVMPAPETPDTAPAAAAAGAPPAITAAADTSSAPAAIEGSAPEEAAAASPGAAGAPAAGGAGPAADAASEPAAAAAVDGSAMSQGPPEGDATAPAPTAAAAAAAEGPNPAVPADLEQLLTLLSTVDVDSDGLALQVGHYYSNNTCATSLICCGRLGVQ
jgi:hypothetical protein